MTYSADLAAYPEEFGALVETGALQGISLDIGSAKDAKRLMGRLYAYKGALMRAAHREDASERIRELYELSKTCQFRVEGTMLVVRPVDQDPDALLIRSFLGTVTQTQPPPLTERADGKILVPMNPAHLPPWLAALAVKRAGEP